MKAKRVKYEPYAPKPEQRDAERLTASSLDGKIAYWYHGICVTAKMDLETAKQKIRNGEAFIISSHTIGAMENGYSVA